MRPQILLVDDNKLDRELLKLEFESVGFQAVGEAGSGAEAIKLLENIRPSLVAMDVRMPVENGLDTLAAFNRIRTRHPDLPIVMISGLNELHVRHSFLQAGALDYLEKPVTRSSIVKLLDKVSGP